MGDYIADLHIHSRYSRGCSTQITIENLEKYSKIKGVDLLGTGDFTHPMWIEEIKANLTDEQNTGIYRTKTGFPFVLQTEVSLIYSQDRRGYRIHLVVLAPNLEVVQQITDYLKTKGRVDYDGRPIFKIPCPEFVESMTNIDTKIEVFPAHAWTPWFSLFGSNSGFDSLKDCFQDQTKNIHALETGLSSDPAMNWRLSQLDSLNLVSFSDMHSFWPWRIGREATVFKLKDLTYNNLIEAFRTKGERNKISYTIETDPNYGKYHYDGHRKCKVVLSPRESMKLDGICPRCKKPLTLGVMNRVEQLADRPAGFKPKNAVGFKHLIPLSEIISTVLNKGIFTQAVWKEFYSITKLGSENEILLTVPKEKLLSSTNEKIVELILKNRFGELKVTPGYDGEYGKLVIDEAIVDEKQRKEKQKGLLKTQRSLDEF
ncbi:DNA helicase UvrD [Candidatus Woesearchaeota archaeon]|nr:MAG: DNA helicase UvrD [Candidatus Woesearchaeota archaeon]